MGSMILKHGLMAAWYAAACFLTGVLMAGAGKMHIPGWQAGSVLVLGLMAMALWHTRMGAKLVGKWAESDLVAADQRIREQTKVQYRGHR